MLQPLQIEDAQVRYAGEIAELREFLAKAGTPLDTPETLHRVTTRLGEDRAFRRDLTSHLWVVLHAGDRPVRQAELLAMLATAAAGPHFAAEAADADAHDLLRFVLQASSAFNASPAPDAPRMQPASAMSPRPTPARPSAPVSFPSAPVSFTRAAAPEREPALALDLPYDAEGQRRMVWTGAGVCALAALCVGFFFLHRHAPAGAAAPAPVVASNAAETAPAALSARDQGHADQRAIEERRTVGPATAGPRASRPAPYSRLAESALDLPPAVTAPHAKPAPGTPMPVAHAAAAPAAVRPYARGSRAASTAKPEVYAGSDSGYVPKAVAVDTLNLRGGPMSAGTSHQAVVRPTSLGIMAANVMYSPAPQYPMAASKARVQGEVKLEAEVGRDGTVESTRIISGPPLLADAAANAVQHWRYRPYLYEGKPIAMNAQIVMDFQLP